MNEASDIHTEIKDRIFHLMESRGISQKEFSNMIGVSAQTITDWKKGKSKSFYQKLPLIASVLNCNLNWLSDGDGEVMPSGDEQSFYRLLDIAYNSRFVKYDGSLTGLAVDDQCEKMPTGDRTSGLKYKFMDLFLRLRPEQQKMIIAQMQGILAVQEQSSDSEESSSQE